MIADLPPSPPSISDYALVRRQFHIFERALKKFKSDVGLWVQYVQVAKREGARALVGRIIARYVIFFFGVNLLPSAKWILYRVWPPKFYSTTLRVVVFGNKAHVSHKAYFYRALQLHPNTPALYILAASHELSQQSPSAARTLLQRGIRLNSDSVEMWREYVRMELGFIEGVRRRWDVLGIDILGKDGKGKEKATLTTGLDGDTVISESEAMKLDFGGGDAVICDNNHNDDDDGIATRKGIMDGAIVKTVISSAAKCECLVPLHVPLHPRPCSSSILTSVKKLYPR